MVDGFILTFFTGFLWAAVGIIFSIAAVRKIELATFMFMGSALGTMFTWVFSPDYGELFSGNVSRLVPLVFWMTCVALLSASGFLALRKAMIAGRHGIAWTMGQAAMLVPFAAGTLLWREESSGFRNAGMLFLALSLPLCATVRENQGKMEEVDKQTVNRNWRVWGFLAFTLIGLSQASSMVPSHWPGWTDTAKLRVPLIFLISSLFWLIPFFQRMHRIDVKRSLPLAITYSVCVLAGQWLLYQALDRMSAIGLSAMVYPLAIGTCIAGFYLYSLVALHEKVHASSFLGVVSAVVGIILITAGSYW